MGCEHSTARLRSATAPCWSWFMGAGHGSRAGFLSLLLFQVALSVSFWEGKNALLEYYLKSWSFFPYAEHGAECCCFFL